MTRNVSAPGYPESHYQHHATQNATGTTQPTAYGSQVPASPWVQQGMSMGYDSSQPFQQPHMGQSPRGPPYSPRLANEPDPPYPLGFARQQGSGPMTPPWSPFQAPAGGANAFGGSHSRQSVVPNASGGSHSQQSVNNESYHIGFIRTPNPGPNRSPPQGHVGVQNTSRGPHPYAYLNCAISVPIPN